MERSVIGTWGYRSFVNDRDLLTPFGNLRFGLGVLKLEVAGPGRLAGSLGGRGWSLDIDGTIFGGDDRVRFRGSGEIGGEEWVYDYDGWLTPAWPNGVDQIDAMVGSIIRVIPHSDGRARAGFVASWIAVRDPVATDQDLL
ncbi:MAG: hypothetical protein ACPGGK_08330 [Pikeienuella sp.]